MPDSLFPNSNIDSVSSNRFIYTPSTFARSSLIHLQETGTLQATQPHTNARSGLSPCLLFTVLRKTGKLAYDGKIYALYSGDCVFIDCKKSYSHETENNICQEQVDTIDFPQQSQRYARPGQFTVNVRMVGFDVLTGCLVLVWEEKTV